MVPSSQVDPVLSTPQADAALESEQCKYLYQLFEADEKEVRQIERYLLLASGAVFSFLANQIGNADYGPLWYFPALLTVLAALRAGALGVRQSKWLELSSEVESRWAGLASPTRTYKNPGWASLYLNRGKTYVTISAVLFYFSLLGLNVYMGQFGADLNRRMASSSHAAAK
jgi:hypothetical protein